MLDHLTDAQRRALVIADNKIAENAGWDEETLRLEIEALQDLEFDVDLRRSGGQAGHVDAGRESDVKCQHCARMHDADWGRSPDNLAPLLPNRQLVAPDVTICFKVSDVFLKLDDNPKGLADCLVGLVEIGGVLPAPSQNCHAIPTSLTNSVTNRETGGNNPTNLHKTHQMNWQSASRFGTVPKFFRNFVNRAAPIRSDQLPARTAC